MKTLLLTLFLGCLIVGCNVKDASQDAESSSQDTKSEENAISVGMDLTTVYGRLKDADWLDGKKLQWRVDPIKEVIPFNKEGKCIQVFHDEKRVHKIRYSPGTGDKAEWVKECRIK